MSNRISFAIHTELFTPTGGVGGGAIVFAHGFDGMIGSWAAMIRDFVTGLAARGFIALIPSYFERF